MFGVPRYLTLSWQNVGAVIKQKSPGRKEGNSTGEKGQDRFIIAIRCIVCLDEAFTMANSIELVVRKETAFDSGLFLLSSLLSDRRNGAAG